MTTANLIALARRATLAMSDQEFDAACRARAWRTALAPMLPAQIARSESRRAAQRVVTSSSTATPPTPGQAPVAKPALLLSAVEFEQACRERRWRQAQSVR